MACDTIVLSAELSAFRATPNFQFADAIAQSAYKKVQSLTLQRPAESVFYGKSVLNGQKTTLEAEAHYSPSSRMNSSWM